MYSKRRKEQEAAAARARGESAPSGFVAEPPEAFRQQLLYALGDAAPGDDPRYDLDGTNRTFFGLLQRRLAEEYGVGQLSRQGRPADARLDLGEFIARDANATQLMDVVDAVSVVLDEISGRLSRPPHGMWSVGPSYETNWLRFADTVRGRLAEHRLPFDIVGGKVVSKDSEELHQATVGPALTLLHGRPRFARVEQQYQDALRELADRMWADAITDANAAVEVTLREITKRQQGQLPGLLAEAKRRGLFGDPQAARMRKVVDAFAVLADIRNQESDAHGKESDRGTAWLAVHWAGALIVYLVEQAEALNL